MGLTDGKQDGQTCLQKQEEKHQQMLRSIQLIMLKILDFYQQLLIC